MNDSFLETWDPMAIIFVFAALGSLVKLAYDFEEGVVEYGNKTHFFGVCVRYIIFGFAAGCVSWAIPQITDTMEALAISSLFGGLLGKYVVNHLMELRETLVRNHVMIDSIAKENDTMQEKTSRYRDDDDDD